VVVVSPWLWRQKAPVREEKRLSDAGFCFSKGVRRFPVARTDRRTGRDRRLNKSKRDLVERLSTKETLDEPWGQLISIFDAIDEKVYVADPVTYEILYANPVMKKIFGEKALGDKCYKVLQDLDSPCDFCTNPLIFGENLGNTHIWEFRNRKTGKWARIIDRAIKWWDGRMVRFAMGIDIHNGKVAEEALRASEEKFRQLVENIHEVIFTTDRDGIVTYVSPAIERLSGFSPSDMVGRHFSDFIYQEDLGYLERRYNHALEGQRRPTEYRMLIKSGGYRWVSTFSRPIREDEKSVGLQGVISDITEYKESEAALRDREKDLKAKTETLEEMNAALRVLLERREKDRVEMEEKVLLNIRELINPYLEKLKKSSADEKQKACLGIIESNLGSITSSFSRDLRFKYLSLTPTEIQIASLIRDGRTTKDIAELMNLSSRTIESHRKNIRRKMGLKDKKANFRTTLLSIR
jgi:PAS domain S-box-containing protein